MRAVVGGEVCQFGMRKVWLGVVADSLESFIPIISGSVRA